MKNKVTMFATASALTTLLATSAFAAPQYHDRDRDRDQRQTYGRENQRYNASGRITSFSHERGGYRVYVDGTRNPYWIPESGLGRHSLRVGIDIATIIGYDDGRLLRGVVERVDYRSGFATLRDDRSGRFVDVRLGRDTQQLRRGDFVTLEGRWDRSDVFDADRIDDVR